MKQKSKRLILKINTQLKTDKKMVKSFESENKAKSYKKNSCQTSSILLKFRFELIRVAGL